MIGGIHFTKLIYEALLLGNLIPKKEIKSGIYISYVNCVRHPPEFIN